MQLDPIFFKAPALRFRNICEIYPPICHGLCTVPGCVLKNPLDKYCAGGGCPGCPGGRCGLYNLFFEELGDPWTVQILDPRGTPVQVNTSRTAKGLMVSFRPSAEFANRIGEYTVVMRSSKAGEFKIKPRLDIGEKALQAPKQ